VRPSLQAVLLSESAGPAQFTLVKMGTFAL
jgi:hypothetical protein